MPFRRPVGAPIDVKELEYVAALHQTCLPVCRENATVSSIDIVRFLRSRFALKVPHVYGVDIVTSMGGGIIGNEVIERILQDALENYQVDLNEGDENNEANDKKRKKLRAIHAMRKRLEKRRKKQQAKDDDEEDPSNEEDEQEQDEDEEDDLFNSREDIVDPHHLPERYLDLVQLLGILLIPTIARAGQEHRDSHVLEEQEEDEEHYSGDEHEEEEHAEGEPEKEEHQEEYDDEEEEEEQEQEYHEEEEVYEEEEEEHLYNQFHSFEEQESLRPKPEGILNDVMHMLLGNLGDGSFDKIEMTEDGPIVSTELVTCLLEAWGEHERAKDVELIEQMVQAAGGQGVVFNLDSFVQALTSDLGKWEVGVEDMISTPHYDVWRYDTIEEEDKMNQQAAVEKAARDDEADGMVQDRMTKHELDPYVARHLKQAVNIDFAVDVHGSTAFTALIWCFFILTALTYAVLIQSLPGPDYSCKSDDYGCQIARTIWVWFSLAILLTVTGLVIIVPLSLGNTPTISSPKMVVFATLAGAVYTYVPYVAIIMYRDDTTKDDGDVAAAVHDPTFDNIQNLVFAIGNAVVFAGLVQFVLVLWGRRNVRNHSSAWVRALFTSSNTRGCYRIKKAATRKVNSMLENARALHPGGDAATDNMVLSSLRGSSNTEETMLNFVLKGEREEPCGGLVWTWKMIFNGQLFDTEGIWINTRIIIFQTIQVIIAIILGYSSFIFVDELAKQAERARRELEESDLGNIPQWVYDMIPTRTDIYAAFYPAFVVLVIVMVAIILIYLPSASSIIIQYRSGVKPSLRSKLFNTYRGNPDTVYLNIANAFYSILGSAVLFYVLFALVIFLFIWDFSRGIMLSLLAWGIGLTITIVLKMIMTMFCRKKFYSGYYRTKPFRANVSLLALECWYIGLGGGILIGRFTQFILAAAFWVGRIDVRFLDENVNLVGYGFDYVPFNFEKDLLGHEAHRHPFIDRLGTMYMMKLKHGDEFCTAGGACWRQLFVVSLMPWMMKYRIFNDDRIAAAMEVEIKRRTKRAKRAKKQGLLVEAKEFGEELAVGLRTGGQGIVEPEELGELKEP